MSRILPRPKKRDSDDSANRAADDLSFLLGDAEEAEETEPASPRRQRGRRAAPAASRSISTASNSGSAHGNSKDGIPKYIDAFTYHDGTPIVCLACKKGKQRLDPAFPEEKIWWKFHGSEDDPHNHSAFDGYCDHIWTPNNSNSNKSNFQSDSSSDSNSDKWVPRSQRSLVGQHFPRSQWVPRSQRSLVG